MKTNLTTKQTKKIQNGKLAIYKDIDTADAREYLLKVLKTIFPKDTSGEINCKNCVIKNVYFCRYDEMRWTGQAQSKTSIINLSQIMYTYNPEQFKPISMLCTEEQWNNDLKPVVEAFGIDFSGVLKWEVCDRITNNYGKGKIIGCYFDTMDKHGKLLPTYSPTEFLEACGIVRADKVEKVCFADAIKVFSGNPRSKSFSSELFKEYTVYPITTDQIKTARTNPETLEKIFPKVFEKPVVEVGKWYRNGNTSHKKSVAFLTDYNKSTNHYKGYGFDIDGNWNNGNDNYVWGSSNWTEATLSDLQPLFEAEFNKRYKEGDLLESPSGALRYYYSKGNVEVLRRFNKVTNNGIHLFHDGNFAKVIKSAELIKAEEELEQAKKKVERLTNK